MARVLLGWGALGGGAGFGGGVARCGGEAGGWSIERPAAGRGPDGALSKDEGCMTVAPSSMSSWVSPVGPPPMEGPSNMAMPPTTVLA